MIVRSFTYLAILILWNQSQAVEKTALEEHRDFIQKMEEMDKKLSKKIWKDVKICLPLIDYYAKHAKGKEGRTVNIDNSKINQNIPSKLDLPLSELSSSEIISEVTLMNRCNFLSYYSKQSEATVFSNGHVNESERKYICKDCHPLLRASFRGYVVQQTDEGLVVVNIERKHISMTRITKYIPDDEILLFVKGAEVQKAGNIIIQGIIDDTKKMSSINGFKNDYRIVHFVDAYRVGAYFKRFTDLSKVMIKNHPKAVCAISSRENKVKYFKVGCFQQISDKAQRWPSSL